MDKDIDDVVEMRHKIVEILECELEKEPAEIDTVEVGEVVDMIKDLYESEMYYYQACVHKAAYEKERPMTNSPMM